MTKCMCTAVVVERLLRCVEPLARRNKVRKALDAHFGNPGRTDLRGRKSTELRKAATTLRHIVGMQQWVNARRYDLNTCRRIRDYLRHIDHNQPWSRTVDECSRARGLANRAGRAWNERREYGPGDPKVLDATHTSHPLNSIAKLRSAGRRGGNCLRYNDFGYHDELRDGVASFHEIRSNDVPVAWIRVERHSRRVTDIYGPGNAEPRLSIEVLRKLCTKLIVSGDYEDTFFRRGVLTIFLRGKIDPDIPMKVIADYRFWWRAGEVVVHDVRDDQWSRFLWRHRQWQAAGPSALDGDAFGAMRRVNPKVDLVALKAILKRRRKPGRRPRRRSSRTASVGSGRGRGRPAE
ncbi:MAG: hypothetical protein F4Y86_09300 [Gammaproteobacteria bacterium]|nr:hypothetical protein [Gammaproteobacteria bacterium]